MRDLRQRSSILSTWWRARAAAPADRPPGRVLGHHENQRSQAASMALEWPSEVESKGYLIGKHPSRRRGYSAALAIGWDAFKKRNVPNERNGWLPGQGSSSSRQPSFASGGTAYLSPHHLSIPRPEVVPHLGQHRHVVQRPAVCRRAGVRLLEPGRPRILIPRRDHQPPCFELEAQSQRPHPEQFPVS